MPSRNPDAEAIKSRRAAARTASTPTNVDIPVALGQGEPPRRHDALFDPAEPRALGVGGPVDGYVVVPEDVFETVTPRGCVTPTARLRWTKGQRVPVDAYRRWEEQQQVASSPDTETPAEGKTDT